MGSLNTMELTAEFVVKPGMPNLSSINSSAWDGWFKSDNLYPKFWLKLIVPPIPYRDDILYTGKTECVDSDHDLTMTPTETQEVPKELFFAK